VATHHDAEKDDNSPFKKEENGNDKT